MPQHTTGPGGSARITPISVGGLAFVTAVVAGFGVIVVGNDLGSALASPLEARAEIWIPLFLFLGLPTALIVAASSLATVTGTRRPSSAVAIAAVAFGTMVGSLSGRLIWRAIEVNAYGEVRNLLDDLAVAVLAGAILVGGTVGALLGDLLASRSDSKRASQWSAIVATALLTFPTMELIAARSRVTEQQLWMLGAMLLALGIVPRLGLLSAEGEARTAYAAHAERDHTASVRLVVGFTAGWMASILINMSDGGFDGQLSRYVIAWILPVVLSAPGVLAHLDGVRDESPSPARIESFGR